MIDLDVLSREYFWFDKPVPYLISDGQEILITPIMVEDSEMFLSWIDVISIDKNSLNDVKYISMSYLEFLVSNLLMSPIEQIAQASISKIINILKLCLNFNGAISIRFNERNKPFIVYEDKKITPKQFEDIRRIILYQNIVGYDDEYINPDIKQMMDEMNEIKTRDIDYPNLERRMAIITAHTGLSKAEQMKMTYRSHTMLMKEVYGEVDYMSARTGVMVGNMFSKNRIEFEDWIYKKKRNKYEQYFTAEDSYNHSMGGSNIIRGNELESSASIDLSSYIK